MAAVALALIAIANFAAYHTFIVVDFKSRSYNRAVATLQSVRVGDPVPYVPVPQKARMAIYAVSPSFESLKPFFEDMGRNWTKPGCQVYPATCGDYAGGWFIWALRDAAARQGHYASAREAADFYDRITLEVEQACRTGRLRCVSSAIPFMPAVTPMQLAQIPAKARDMIAMLTGQIDAPTAPDSGGTADQLEKMWEFEGYPRRTPAETDAPSNLVGWFYAKSGAWLQLACSKDGQNWVVPIARAASPDIAQTFKDPAAIDRRFTVALPPTAPCRIGALGAPADAGLTYDQLLQKPQWPLADGRLFIDSYGSTTRSVVDLRVHRALDKLAWLYRRLTPLLLLAAAAGYLVHAVLVIRRSARLDGYWLLVHALWLGVLCRAAILILVDISSFPGVTLLYTAASIPLTYGALLLTAWLPFYARGRPQAR